LGEDGRERRREIKPRGNDGERKRAKKRAKKESEKESKKESDQTETHLVGEYEGL
jgi:hypothetical protein